jgi:hypothetical protein
MEARFERELQEKLGAAERESRAKLDQQKRRAEAERVAAAERDQELLARVAAEKAVAVAETEATRERIFAAAGRRMLHRDLALAWGQWRSLCEQRAWVRALGERMRPRGLVGAMREWVKYVARQARRKLRQEVAAVAARQERAAERRLEQAKEEAAREVSAVRADANGARRAAELEVSEAKEAVARAREVASEAERRANRTEQAAAIRRLFLYGLVTAWRRWGEMRWRRALARPLPQETTRRLLMPAPLKRWRHFASDCRRRALIGQRLAAEREERSALEERLRASQHEKEEQLAAREAEAAAERRAVQGQLEAREQELGEAVAAREAAEEEMSRHRIAHAVAMLMHRGLARAYNAWREGTRFRRPGAPCVQISESVQSPQRCE